MVRERMRVIYHTLPFKNLPKIMVRMLGMIVAYQLNLFPAKSGVSEYLSPHVLLEKKNIDYKKHCEISFGSYVQAYQDNNPTNTPRSRTVDAIYLRPLNNIQGGHEVMNLATGNVITPTRVWEVPMTDLVIKAVNEMGKKQGMMDFKIQGRH